MFAAYNMAWRPEKVTTPDPKEISKSIKELKEISGYLTIFAIGMALIGGTLAFGGEDTSTILTSGAALLLSAHALGTAVYFSKTAKLAQENLSKNKTMETL